MSEDHRLDVERANTTRQQAVGEIPAGSTATRRSTTNDAVFSPFVGVQESVPRMVTESSRLILYVSYLGDFTEAAFFSGSTVIV